GEEPEGGDPGGGGWLGAEGDGPGRGSLLRLGQFQPRRPHAGGGPRGPASSGRAARAGAGISSPRRACNLLASTRFRGPARGRGCAGGDLGAGGATPRRQLEGPVHLRPPPLRAFDRATEAPPRPHRRRDHGPRRSVAGGHRCKGPCAKVGRCPRWSFSGPAERRRRRTSPSSPTTPPGTSTSGPSSRSTAFSATASGRGTAHPPSSASTSTTTWAPSRGTIDGTEDRGGPGAGE